MSLTKDARVVIYDRNMFITQTTCFWTKCYKNILSVIYELSHLARVFVSDKLYKPIQMFVGKARSLP